MLNQRGKALYNDYGLLEYNDYNLRTNYTKPDYIKVNTSNYIESTYNINQAYKLNSKIRQDNKTFKNYMINLCKSYIDNIDFRDKPELVNSNELKQLYYVLIGNSTNLPKFSRTSFIETNLTGGYERNYTYTVIDKNNKTVVKINWSIDDSEYINLNYTKSIDDKVIKIKKYIVGDEDNEDVINELMNILNVVLTNFHNENLCKFENYTSIIKLYHF